MDQLTLEQLCEWEAFNKIEPIGEYRRDYRIAMIASMLFNLAQSIYGKSGKMLRSRPEDFMPWLDGPRSTTNNSGQQSVAEMKSILLAMASHTNKSKKKGK